MKITNRKELSLQIDNLLQYKTAEIHHGVYLYPNRYYDGYDIDYAHRQVMAFKNALIDALFPESERLQALRHLRDTPGDQFDGAQLALIGQLAEAAIKEEEGK